jgi:hypothetical protein
MEEGIDDCAVGVLMLHGEATDPFNGIQIAIA